MFIYFGFSKTFTMVKKKLPSKGHDNDIVEHSTTKGVSCTCFRHCLRRSDDLDSTDGEVTKPLYFIVDEVSTQQVRDFELSKNNQLSKKLKDSLASVEERMHPRFAELRRRLARHFQRHSREQHDSETASVTRVGSCAASDETDYHQRSKITRIVYSQPEHSVHSDINSLIKQPDNKVGYKRFRMASLCSYKIDSTGEALGVAFPHPAFARFQSPLLSGVTGKPPKVVTNEFWPIVETASGCTDETRAPQGKTIVQTDAVNSWGSTGSSSFYPTDEQSNVDQDSFDDGFNSESNNDSYDGFNSECDLPFDELTMDNLERATARLVSRNQEELSRIADAISTSHYLFDHDDDGNKSKESFLWITPQEGNNQGYVMPMIQVEDYSTNKP
jgi:hypothetical protein